MVFMAGRRPIGDVEPDDIWDEEDEDDDLDDDEVC